MKKALFLFLFAIAFIRAEDPSVKFEEANKAFKSGNYREAIGTYRQLEREGYRGAELFFNLGLAYSRAGETGHSILYLEKALLYDRNNRKANLLLVNENLKIKEKIVKVPEFFIFKFFRDISTLATVWVWLVIVFLLFLFLTVSITAYILRYKGLTRFRFFIITGTLSLFFAISIPAFLISYDSVRNLRECVVLDSNIHLYEVPETGGKSAGLITEGNKLEIIDEISGWFRVILPNGKEGWIMIKGVGEV